VGFSKIARWPADGIVLTDRRPIFAWSEVQSATWYHLWFSRNGRKYFEKWLPQTTVSWQPDFDLPGSEYKWWVQSWSDVNGIGTWSDAAEFVISNMVPAKIELTAPTGSIDTNYPTFAWDEDIAASEYQLWLQHNGIKYGDWSIVDKNSFVISRALPYGFYDWWVRGYSVDGYGSWSDKMSFKYGICEPLSPVGIISDTYSPEFSWIALAQAEWYQLAILQNGRMVRNQWVKGDSKYAFARKFKYGKYSWQVRAWNKNGLGPWSRRVEFIVGGVEPESATKEQLTWNDRGGVDSTWYQLWVNDDSGSPVFGEWIEKVDTVVDGDNRYYNLPTSLGYGEYKFWLRAWSPDYGMGPWSSELEFSVVPPFSSLFGSSGVEMRLANPPEVPDIPAPVIGY
jgi:hypothetical protein